MKLRAKNVMYYKYGSRSKVLRSCELKYDSGNDFIEVVNTGIPVQYMGEMYGIYFYDNYGNRIPEFLFSKEKASEFVGEYIEDNYY